MVRRVNFMLEDSVWRVLKQVEKGERSKVVNSAIAGWFRERRRWAAMRQMDKLRSQLTGISATQIAAWVREDRERTR